jgi:hypothetical protein
VFEQRVQLTAGPTRQWRVDTAGQARGPEQGVVKHVAATRKWSPQEHDDAVEELGIEARRAAEAAEALHLATTSRPPAKDTPPFAHLAVRSSYSLRDGVIRPRELAAAAAAAGMSHVALTDRDGLYGVVRFAQACAQEGVMPVFGTDLALAPDHERPGWELTRAGRVRGTAPDTRGSAPDTGGSGPDTRGSAPDTRGSAPDTRGPAPGARGVASSRASSGR